MRYLPFTLLLCALTVPAGAITREDVLSRMDQNGPSFKSLTGNLNALNYTKVIDDKAEESGTIAVKKNKPKDVQFLVDFTKPDPRTVSFRGRKAEIFYPKIKTVQEYDLGKQSNMVESFLLLGFGATGKDLASNYDVKYVGEETINGQKASHLELIPKSADTRKSLSKLELWMSEDGTYPVRQKIYDPSGNYRVFTYSDVKVNPALSADAVTLKLPSGVKREYPQRDR